MSTEGPICNVCGEPLPHERCDPAKAGDGHIKGPYAATFDLTGGDLPRESAPYALTDSHVAALELAIRAEGYDILADDQTGAVRLDRETASEQESGHVAQNPWSALERILAISKKGRLFGARDWATVREICLATLWRDPDEAAPPLVIQSHPLYRGGSVPSQGVEE